MDHRKPHPEFYDMAFTTEEFNGMPYRYLGRSGLRVSIVGPGAWKIGHPETGDGARVDGKSELAMLDRAVELGVTLIPIMDSLVRPWRIRLAATCWEQEGHAASSKHAMPGSCGGSVRVLT